MIQEAYCSFEVSKLLKEKGFKGECFAAYNGNGKFYGVDEEVDDNVPYWSDAPTHQMAMGWLRGKGIAVVPFISGVLDNKSFLWDVTIRVAETNDTYSQGWIYEEYEEAVEAALKYTLENLI